MNPDARVKPLFGGINCGRNNMQAKPFFGESTTDETTNMLLSQWRAKSDRCHLHCPGRIEHPKWRHSNPSVHAFRSWRTVHILHQYHIITSSYAHTPAYGIKQLEVPCTGGLSDSARSMCRSAKATGSCLQLQLLVRQNNNEIALNSLKINFNA